MEKNEVIKGLYKENPKANLVLIRDGFVHYSASLSDGTIIMFKIPLEETKGADFFCEMDSKHLIRWIASFIKDE